MTESVIALIRENHAWPRGYIGFSFDVAQVGPKIHIGLYAFSLFTFSRL